MQSVALDRHWRTLHAGGAKVKTFVARIPSRDMVLLKPAQLTLVKGGKTIEFPVGSLTRHNWTLAERTDKQSGDAFFDCLYDLRDSGRHTVVGYGHARRNPHGEAAQIRVDHVTAKAFTFYLLRTGAYSPEDKAKLELLQAELIASYAVKTDPRKVTARERWIKGLVMTDSLGRNNPSHAAMITGAGIQHLLKRVGVIAQLSTAVDVKTVKVDAYIQAHLALYRELWDALIVSRNYDTRGEVLRFIDIAAEPRRVQSQRENALRALIDLFSGFDAALSNIVARPFCRNAAHTRKDIAEAVRRARVQDFAGLRRLVGRIRDGIRWVFVLDHLREKVMVPLSFLLERLHQKVSTERRIARREAITQGRSLGPVKRKKILLSRDMAPEDFARIEQSLETFVGKLHTCSDDDLATKVKSSVYALSIDALRAMKADNWPLAKKRLEAAASKLLRVQRHDLSSNVACPGLTPRGIRFFIAHRLL